MDKPPPPQKRKLEKDEKKKQNACIESNKRRKTAAHNISNHEASTSQKAASSPKPNKNSNKATKVTTAALRGRINRKRSKRDKSGEKVSRKRPLATHPDISTVGSNGQEGEETAKRKAAPPETFKDGPFILRKHKKSVKDRYTTEEQQHDEKAQHAEADSNRRSRRRLLTTRHNKSQEDDESYGEALHSSKRKAKKNAAQTELTAVGQILAEEILAYEREHSELLSDMEKRHLRLWSESVQSRLRPYSAQVMENVAIVNKLRTVQRKVDTGRDKLVKLRAQTRNFTNDAAALEVKQKEAKEQQTALVGASKFLEMVESLAKQATSK